MHAVSDRTNVAPRLGCIHASARTCSAGPSCLALAALATAKAAKDVETIAATRLDLRGGGRDAWKAGVRAGMPSSDGS